MTSAGCGGSARGGLPWPSSAGGWSCCAPRADANRPVRRATIQNVAASVLCAVGLPAFSRRRHRDRLAIVMFHGVEDEPLSPACWHVLGAALYRRQLEYLSKHFNVLALEEALDRLAAGTLPPRALAIT